MVFVVYSRTIPASLSHDARYPTLYLRCVTVQEIDRHPSYSAHSDDVLSGPDAEIACVFLFMWASIVFALLLVSVASQGVSFFFCAGSYCSPTAYVHKSFRTTTVFFASKQR